MFKDVACGLARPWFGGIGCIVALHRVVRPDRLSRLAENRALEITPVDLRSILEWVRRRGLDVIRIDEVRNRLGQPRGEKFICFTFDDGYRDNLSEALKVFRDFGFPFAVNVTTGFTNRTTSVWWYTLEDILARHSSLAIEWNGRALQWQWTGPEQREEVFAELATLIRSESIRDRDELIRCICRATDTDPIERTRELAMDWDEIAELAAAWHVSIGAHTVGHHTLSLLSPEDVEAEFIDSKAELEARLGKRVQHLAYPFGGRNAVGRREFDLARECDYITAVTTRNGNLFKEHAWQLQALPRLGISGNYPVLSLLNRLESGLVPARANGWKRLVVE
jgi:peptidoglycan/xylan/chitin deacetylase (PgdA/CDA1 family)